MDSKESIMLYVSSASVFIKKGFPFFKLVVGLSGKLGMFAFRICATLEKWLLNVNAFSAEAVTKSLLILGLSLGLTRLVV